MTYSLTVDNIISLTCNLENTIWGMYYCWITMRELFTGIKWSCYRFISFEGNLLPQCPENLKNYYCSCTISGGHTISYQNGYVDSVHSCSCEGIFNAEMCLWLPSDCQELRSKGIDVDGLYSIFPSWKGMLPMDVMCNMSLKGGGWTVSLYVTIRPGQKTISLTGTQI